MVDKSFSTDELRGILISRLTNELPVLRARLGLSQADLADKIGLSRQTYNSVETKKKCMTWTTCVALVAVFQNNSETNKLLKAMDEINSLIQITISGEIER